MILIAACQDHVSTEADIYCWLKNILASALGNLRNVFGSLLLWCLMAKSCSLCLLGSVLRIGTFCCMIKTLRIWSWEPYDMCVKVS